MEEKSTKTIALAGRNREPVEVCNVVNGKPKVKRRIKGDYIEFVLRYSFFRKEVKRYDKRTLEEIK